MLGLRVLGGGPLCWGYHQGEGYLGAGSSGQKLAISQLALALPNSLGEVG